MKTDKLAWDDSISPSKIPAYDVATDVFCPYASTASFKRRNTLLIKTQNEMNYKNRRNYEARLTEVRMEQIHKDADKFISKLGILNVENLEANSKYKEAGHNFIGPLTQLQIKAIPSKPNPKKQIHKSTKFRKESFLPPIFCDSSPITSEAHQGLESYSTKVFNEMNENLLVHRITSSGIRSIHKNYQSISIVINSTMKSKTTRGLGDKVVGVLHVDYSITIKKCRGLIENTLHQQIKSILGDNMAFAFVDMDGILVPLKNEVDFLVSDLLSKNATLKIREAKLGTQFWRLLDDPQQLSSLESKRNKRMRSDPAGRLLSRSIEKLDKLIPSPTKSKTRRRIKNRKTQNKRKLLQKQISKPNLNTISSPLSSIPSSWRLFYTEERQITISHPTLVKIMFIISIYETNTGTRRIGSNTENNNIVVVCLPVSDSITGMSDPSTKTSFAYNNSFQMINVSWGDVYYLMHQSNESLNTIVEITGETNVLGRELASRLHQRSDIDTLSLLETPFFEFDRQIWKGRLGANDAVISGKIFNRALIFQIHKNNDIHNSSFNNTTVCETSCNYYFWLGPFTLHSILHDHPEKLMLLQRKNVSQLCDALFRTGGGTEMDSSIIRMTLCGELEISDLTLYRYNRILNDRDWLVNVMVEEGSYVITAIDKDDENQRYSIYLDPNIVIGEGLYYSEDSSLTPDSDLYDKFAHLISLLAISDSKGLYIDSKDPFINESLQIFLFAGARKIQCVHNFTDRTDESFETPSNYRLFSIQIKYSPQSLCSDTHEILIHVMSTHVESNRTEYHISLNSKEIPETVITKYSKKNNIDTIRNSELIQLIHSEIRYNIQLDQLYFSWYVVESSKNKNRSNSNKNIDLKYQMSNFGENSFSLESKSNDNLNNNCIGIPKRKFILSLTGPAQTEVFTVSGISLIFQISVDKLSRVKFRAKLNQPMMTVTQRQLNCSLILQPSEVKHFWKLSGLYYPSQKHFLHHLCQSIVWDEIRSRNGEREIKLLLGHPYPGTTTTTTTTTATSISSATTYHLGLLKRSALKYRGMESDGALHFEGIVTVCNISCAANVFLHNDGISYSIRDDRGHLHEVQLDFEEFKNHLDRISFPEEPKLMGPHILELTGNILTFSSGSALHSSFSRGVLNRNRVISFRETIQSFPHKEKIYTSSKHVLTGGKGVRFTIFIVDGGLIEVAGQAVSPSIGLKETLCFRFHIKALHTATWVQHLPGILDYPRRKEMAPWLIPMICYVKPHQLGMYDTPVFYSWTDTTAITNNTSYPAASATITSTRKSSGSYKIYKDITRENPDNSNHIDKKDSNDSNQNNYRNLVFSGQKVMNQFEFYIDIYEIGDDLLVNAVEVFTGMFLQLRKKKADFIQIQFVSESVLRTHASIYRNMNIQVEDLAGSVFENLVLIDETMKTNIVDSNNDNELPFRLQCTPKIQVLSPHKDGLQNQGIGSTRNNASSDELENCSEDGDSIFPSKGITRPAMKTNFQVELSHNQNEANSSNNIYVREETLEMRNSEVNTELKDGNSVDTVNDDATTIVKNSEKGQDSIKSENKTHTVENNMDNHYKHGASNDEELAHPDPRGVSSNSSYYLSPSGCKYLIKGDYLRHRFYRYYFPERFRNITDSLDFWKHKETAPSSSSSSSISNHHYTAPDGVCFSDRMKYQRYMSDFYIRNKTLSKLYITGAAK